jgi:hypothetical protein
MLHMPSVTTTTIVAMYTMNVYITTKGFTMIVDTMIITIVEEEV